MTLVLIFLGALDYGLTPAASALWISRNIPPRLLHFRESRVTLKVRNRTRRWLFLRWKDELNPHLIAEVPEGRLWLPPLGQASLTYSILPRRRGDFTLSQVFIRFYGPFGLAGRQVKIPLSTSIRVFPDLSPVNQYLNLLAHQEEYLMGVRIRRLFGQGTSFESLRSYLPDDDPRHIDWKATARTGSLMVKNYEEEPFQDVYAFLDCGRMMRSRIAEKTKLDYAVEATFLLSYAAYLSRDRFGILAFDRKIQRFLPPSSGSRIFSLTGEALYNLQPQFVEPAYETAFLHFSSRVIHRTLVVIFSDLLDEYSSQTLLTECMRLRPRHLPLLIIFQNEDVEALAHTFPRKIEEVYRKAASIEFLSIRHAIMARLQSAGIEVVETSASQMAVNTINAYYRIKSRGLL